MSMLTTSGVDSHSISMDMGLDLVGEHSRSFGPFPVGGRIPVRTSLGFGLRILANGKRRWFSSNFYFKTHTGKK